MKYDVWRFLGVLFLSTLLGILSGYVAFCIILGLIVFICWQYNEFRKILLWLKKRKEVSSPCQVGIIDETCREIDYLRDRHKLRKKKLGGYLKRFQEGTSALPDAVIILGSQGEIEWANDKAEEYIGVFWPKDVGLRLSNLVRYPELIEYLNAGETGLERGLQIVSPVDSRLVIEVRLSPYGDTQKLLVARDVTAISQINQMRKDFIANASHELRTPLTVISGYLEGFVDDPQCPEAWVTYIQQMRSQSIRMQRLIEDLMQLSLLEAKSEKKDVCVIPVPDMLATITNEARSLSGFMNHDITLNVDQSLYLNANQQEIHSIFSNLVFNAVQYTPECGCIDVAWYEDDDGVHFSVQDDGFGIAPEHIPRLTERFYRIDAGRSREKGGTGLGLAIVKHALARYEGSLFIDSELNKGSLFRCDFPKSCAVRSENDLKKTLSA